MVDNPNFIFNRKNTWMLKSDVNMAFIEILGLLPHTVCKCVYTVHHYIFKVITLVLLDLDQHMFGKTMT